MTKTITHGTCGIEMTCHTDYISVKNADGEHLGNIFSANPAEDWKKIANGACPICDEWEDGLGHACTADGWPAVTHEGGKQEMTINYDSVAYCANVHKGKVDYYKEYSLNGRIVYTVNITYEAYIEATGRK